MEKSSNEQWREFRDWLAQGGQVGNDLQGWIESGLADRIDETPLADLGMETGAIQSELQQKWKAWTDWLDSAPPFVMKGLEENGWRR